MVKINFSIELPDSEVSSVKSDFDGFGIPPVNTDSSLDSSFKLNSKPYPKLVLNRNDVNTLDIALEILESVLKTKQIDLHLDIKRIADLIRDFLVDCQSLDK